MEMPVEAEAAAMDEAIAPQDSVGHLLDRARWADGEAYLKLADCYREGYGVKKDFLSMITMGMMAEECGAISRIDDYIAALPENDEYKRLFTLMDSFSASGKVGGDSIRQALLDIGSADAKALAGMVMAEQGDSVAAARMLQEASDRGSSFATLMLAGGWNAKAEPSREKLAAIADRVPLVYSMLGDLYYAPDENGHNDIRKAMEYYMKAYERGLLSKRGAQYMLWYYEDGGNAQLTADDLKRLEKIVATMRGE